MKNALVLTLLCCACSSGLTFTRTGEQKRAPRRAECSFSVFTTPPRGEYKEVGVIEFPDVGAAPGVGSTDDARRAAAPIVCKNGGTGLILDEEADGRYRVGTVVWSAQTPRLDRTTVKPDPDEEDDEPGDESKPDKP